MSQLGQNSPKQLIPISRDEQVDPKADVWTVSGLFDGISVPEV
jgi:hypothetical protein